MSLTPYQTRGFENRTEYLRSLAAEYEIDENSVFSLAELLGPSEDFDGLLSDLEDFSDFMI